MSSNNTVTGLSALFYRGPALDDLHHQYAQQRRLDSRAPVQARAETVIDASPAQAWRKLAAVGDWPSWQPSVHDVVLESPPAPDVPFTWANGSTRMKSRFAVVEPDQELSWTGRAAGARAVHRNVFEAMPDGRCRVISTESMAGVGISMLFPSAKAQAALEQLLSRLKSAVETNEASGG